MTEDHLTPERLAEIEAYLPDPAESSGARLIPGGISDYVSRLEKDIPALTTEVRRCWAEIGHLNAVCQVLLSMMSVETCPYETNGYCPFTPGDNCHQRDVTSCWSAWADKKAGSSGCLLDGVEHNERPW